MLVQFCLDGITLDLARATRIAIEDLERPLAVGQRFSKAEIQSLQTSV